MLAHVDRGGSRNSPGSRKSGLEPVLRLLVGLLNRVKAVVDGIEPLQDLLVLGGLIFVFDLNQRRKGDAALEQKSQRGHI